MHEGVPGRLWRPSGYKPGWLKDCDIPKKVNSCLFCACACISSWLLGRWPAKHLLSTRSLNIFPYLSGLVIVNSDTKFAVEQHFHIQCWILSRCRKVWNRMECVIPLNVQLYQTLQIQSNRQWFNKENRKICLKKLSRIFTVWCLKIPLVMVKQNCCVTVF